MAGESMSHHPQVGSLVNNNGQRQRSRDSSMWIAQPQL